MSILTCGGMDFARKLQALRAARRYSQQQLGAAVGASQNAIRKWEAGETLPKLDVAAKLAAVLGVGVDYLADDSRDEPAAAPSPAEAEAVKMVRAMRLDEAEVIRRLSAGAVVPARVRDIPRVPFTTEVAATGPAPAAPPPPPASAPATPPPAPASGAGRPRRSRGRSTG